MFPLFTYTHILGPVHVSTRRETVLHTHTQPTHTRKQTRSEHKDTTSISPPQVSSNINSLSPSRLTNTYRSSLPPLRGVALVDRPLDLLTQLSTQHTEIQTASKWRTAAKWTRSSTRFGRPTSSSSPASIASSGRSDRAASATSTWASV